MSMRSACRRGHPGGAVHALWAFAVAVMLLLASCAPGEVGKTTADAEAAERKEDRTAERAGQTIRLVHPRWSSEIASAHLMQAVLQERLGYRVRLVPVEVEEMWRRVASGEADVLTGAWLPATHRDYYDEYGVDLEDLGPNLTGARIGLVVPTSTPGRQTGGTGKTGRDLVTIRSIEELRGAVDRFDGRIAGIESGAGVMARTRDALEAYDLARLYHLVDTDEERMLDRVAKAIYSGEWIVFTGWKPHWVFEHHSLRFLDDPKGVYGGEESIHTMVRRGFEEEMPDAYTVLKRVSYEPEDLERLMRWIHEDEEGDPYRQAVRWIEARENTVDEWVEGVE